ncbi:hypothetical protein J6Z48_02295 [bacterium]|nr:hypothetical protein [bacterium]
MVEVKQFDKIETKDGRLAAILFHKIGTDYALVEYDDDGSDDNLLLEDIKRVIKK